MRAASEPRLLPTSTAGWGPTNSARKSAIWGRRRRAGQGEAWEKAAGRRPPGRPCSGGPPAEAAAPTTRQTGATPPHTPPKHTPRRHPPCLTPPHLVPPHLHLVLQLRLVAAALAQQVQRPHLVPRSRQHADVAAVVLRQAAGGVVRQRAEDAREEATTTGGRQRQHQQCAGARQRQHQHHCAGARQRTWLLAPKPWMSTTGGPHPAVTYLRGSGVGAMHGGHDWRCLASCCASAAHQRRRACPHLMRCPRHIQLCVLQAAAAGACVPAPAAAASALALLAAARAGGTANRLLHRQPACCAWPCDRSCLQDRAGRSRAAAGLPQERAARDICGWAACGACPLASWCALCSAMRCTKWQAPQARQGGGAGAAGCS